jgi:hypothetical protein
MVPLPGPDDPPLTPDRILLIYERILRAILVGLLVVAVAFVILRIPGPPGPVDDVSISVADLVVATSYWRDDGLASHGPLWQTLLAKVNVSNARDGPLITGDLMFHIDHGGVESLELPCEHALADPRFPEGELKRTSPYVRPRATAEGWVVFLVPPGLPVPPDGRVTVGASPRSGGDGPEAMFDLSGARDAGGAPGRLRVVFLNATYLDRIGPYQAPEGSWYIVCDFRVENQWYGPVEFTLFSMFIRGWDGSLQWPDYTTQWVNEWDTHVVVAAGQNVTVRVVFLQSSMRSGSYGLADDVPVLALGSPYALS